MLVTRREAVALALSMGVHASMLAYVLWSTSTPELPFEFEMPMEVEFGLTEAVEVSAGQMAQAAPPEPTPAPDPDGEGEGAAIDAGVPSDAGPPDAGQRPRPDAGPGEPLASAEGEGEGTGEEGEGGGDEGEGRGVAFLPAGSQIALRLDVARVRASPVAAEVRALLAVMPDWQVLLDGSGVEPLDDLDRVLFATPNLERSRFIFAGRATGGEEAIRRAAAQLAIAGGQPIEWANRHGVPVAPWHDRSGIERVIALIGPRHFLICRPQDVPRVLAVARHRAAEEAEEEGEERPREHPADALLSMEEGEGLTLEIEGARNFARASPRRGRSPLEMLPTDVRLALTEQPDDEVAARTRWTYENDDQAQDASAYWNDMKDQFSRNIIASVLGVSGILRRAELEPTDDHIDGSVDLRAAELRQVLNLARQMFADRARARERREQERQQAEAGGTEGEVPDQDTPPEGEGEPSEPPDAPSPEPAAPPPPTPPPGEGD